MWELDHKESWSLKNWCFWTVVLDKTLESPMDSKEVKPVNPKENQPWIFIGRTDAEAEAPILGTPMWKADSLEKILMLGKIEGRMKRENEMIGVHHRLNGYEFEQTSGASERGAWCAVVRGVSESQAWATEHQQSDFLRSK